MKGIRKLKNGTYSIRLMKKGIRKTEYAKTFLEARKKLSKLKKTNYFEDKKIYTMKKWYEEWMQTYKQDKVTQKTLALIISAGKAINKQFGKYYIKDIKTLEIQKWLNELKKNRTADRIYMYFNASMQKAEDLDLIRKNPLKAVEKGKKIKYKHNCYNMHEQELIVNAIKNSNIEHEIMIYLMTGCRPNELPPKNNFDFKSNLIVINGTKNEKSKFRQVEMTQQFANYMQEYFKNNEIKKESFVQINFKEICTKLKIEKPLLYRLRHTFATNHFVLGTPAKLVADWLGHSTTNLTLNTYTDVDRTITKQKIKDLYKNFYFEQN